MRILIRSVQHLSDHSTEEPKGKFPYPFNRRPAIRIIRELIYNLLNRHGSKQQGITNCKFLATDVKLGIKRG